MDADQGRITELEEETEEELWARNVAADSDAATRHVTLNILIARERAACKVAEERAASAEAKNRALNILIARERAASKVAEERAAAAEAKNRVLNATLNDERASRKAEEMSMQEEEEVDSEKIMDRLGDIVGELDKISLQEATKRLRAL